ncbi:MAG: bifunctional folylpolyglutamate synthase/dihydrofolate synthase [Dysosmobacter sp.]
MEDFGGIMETLCAPRWQDRKPGLDRMAALLALLGDPQKQLRFVHITGTNGKGSTAAMLAAVLTAAGYSTGLFTSPHLRRYNERIRVDGREISDGELSALLEEVRPLLARLGEKPSQFELLTALGLLYFQRKGCDLAVLEVGMGGRLDPTNVIPSPETAVITAVGLDHTAYLGTTVPQVAGEKAGIIKPGCEVILSHQNREVLDVVAARCADTGARLTVTAPEALTVTAHSLDGQRFSYRDRQDLRIALLGPYQTQNASAALDAADALRRRGWTIPEEAIRRGLASASWPGRFEVLQRRPDLIVDGAHNPNGAAALADCLRTCLPNRPVTFVMGVMADKDSAGMLDLMAPLARSFVTVTPDSSRALDAAALASDIRSRFGLTVRDAGTVEDGVALALSDAGPEDAVCVFGSLYQVGTVRAMFGRE